MHLTCLFLCEFETKTNCDLDRLTKVIWYCEMLVFQWHYQQSSQRNFLQGPTWHSMYFRVPFFNSKISFIKHSRTLVHLQVISDKNMIQFFNTWVHKTLHIIVILMPFSDLCILTIILMPESLAQTQTIGLCLPGAC